MDIDIRQLSVDEFKRLFDTSGFLQNNLADSHALGTFTGVNYSRWERIEQGRALLALGAFDGEKPIGYCAGYTMRLPYFSEVYLVMDSMYVLPEYRRSLATGYLMKTFADIARHSHQVKGVIWSALAGSPLRRTLERHFKLHSITYIQEL